MKLIRYAIHPLIFLLLIKCETANAQRKAGSEETRQSYQQESSNQALSKQFQEDMKAFSTNWKSPIIDYDSIPLNKEEPFGKPILSPTIGHSSPIISVAFSPDGKYVLTGSEDKTAVIWDLSGNQIRTFKGHSREVVSVIFSPDGKYILTGSWDKTATLWDLNGNQIRTFKGHSSIVTSVAFSPDGKYVLTGSSDEMTLWDLSGNQIRAFKGHSSGVVSVAFSPDGKYVLTGSEDKTAVIWDLSGNQIRSFKGHSSSVTSAVFSPDGKYVLTGGGWDKTAILWDLSGNQILTFSGHSGRVTSVAFSPDGKYVLTGSADRTAIIWDLSGNQIRNFRGNSWTVTSVAFSPDGKYALTGNYDSIAVIWDLNGNQVLTLKSSSSVVHSVAFSPDGKHVLAGITDKRPVIWDLSGHQIRMFEGHSGPVAAVAFSPDGKHVLTGSSDKTAILWDLSGHQIQTFKGHSGYVVTVAFSPDGKYILTGSFDNTAILWDLNGNQIRTFKGHSNYVVTAAFSPDGKHVLTGGWDKTAILWDLSGEQIQTFKGHSDFVTAIAFSPDGKHVLTGSSDKTAILWDLSGNQTQTFKGHSSDVKSVVFSADGKYILTGSGDNTAIRWGLNGSQIRTFKRHSGDVKSVAFSPDGTYALTGGQDGTTRISSIDGERSIAMMVIRDGQLTFTNDGRFDYTGEKMKSLVNFRKGGTNELITLDSLFDEFYTPGLLQKFFGGKGSKKPEKDLEEIIKKSPIPQVTTNTNSGESESATGTANVTVTACDKGGGAEDIRLYHNNALVDLEATRGIKINSSGKCQTKAFDVALFPGENSFRGSARNRENLWGYSDYLRLAWKPKEKTKPTQHLVVIGVNQYSGNTFSSLQYAVPDAKLFQESLLSKSKNLYGKTEVYELYDGAATRDGIRTLLKNVANKVKPENGDVLILFFAGHGVSVDNQYYFIPAKYSGDAGKSSLDAGAFPQTMLVDLVSAIHAEKKLIVLDSCQSGGSEWEGSIGRFSHASGVGIIAAAQSVQFALESSKFGHGLLTYSISDEIKNGQREKDGKLYLNILASRVKRAVEKLAAERKHKQDPYTMIKSDFELAE